VLKNKNYWERCFLCGPCPGYLRIQLCVGSDTRITWRLHIEMIEAKAFRTFLEYIPYSKVND
jgi:hypothetical protein